MPKPMHCPPGGPCSTCHPGHNVHWIQASHAGRDPGVWRRGSLIDVQPDKHLLEVTYPSGRHVQLWRHGNLAGLAAMVGSPVRTAERWSLLDVAGAWLSVLVMTDREPDLDPRDRDDLADGVAITDLRLGVAFHEPRNGN